MLNKSLVAGALALAFQFSCSPIFAGVSADQAARLGKDLTPLGGERAANSTGSIPAWDGGITRAPAGYKPGDHHLDPFPDDKPLFTIDKANLAQYRANLTAGQIALFDTYPDSFRMPVYVTRRSASAPQWVYDNTRKNAVTAKLADGGNGFTDAFGGIPFPVPQSGVEALWNHIVRYRGTHIVRQSTEVAMQRDGSYTPIDYEQESLFRYYDPQGSYEKLDNILFYFVAFVKTPPRLAGYSSLVHETMDQVKEPRQAWGYNAGQRRVRRSPNLAYDTPVPASDGLRTTDDTDMFNGAPDRFEWKLLGKREVYIPYNNYRLAAAGVKYADLLQPGHLNPALTRYELHRVWVVEGTLKPDARHIYSKRTFYLDEDSWQIAVADQYDSRGKIWRVSMAYLKNFYELPTTWSAVEVYHDLYSHRYNVQGLDSEQKSAIDFQQPSPGDSYFNPSELRQRGTR
ncbi:MULTISPECIES: DUF1329 domain-containing protein [unclassified Pseudomonas]|uniref:DUF1329 domain-containing protein n=1 Tax=unclassified Pseudomonas TaxID=196821 RepID=UPI000730229A|nr:MULTISPECIES: DUF1329 domain-containing protein [unclassified Pseudomonas]KSW25816.1 hypothetical protein AOX63_19285 [Pseudomonas sp. ADP]OBP12333.1 outer membrane lipoprotein-sorting protein [Pseudomonas sp. EGD-AKN5]QOF82417.1 DUF1329 domain-containing protein [Pseudomonas sp. ADPe]GLU42123.1 hypothetical protein Pssp01_62160 [Pseudomonas sp. NBRC 100443]